MAFPMQIPRLATLSFVAAIAGACGDGNLEGPPAGGAAATNEVRVSNNFFDPASRTVPVGTVFTWRWSAGSVLHNVTFNDGPASATQSSGTYQRTFSAAGSYPYLCTIHGAAMSGTVTVP